MNRKGSSRHAMRLRARSPASGNPDFDAISPVAFITVEPAGHHPIKPGIKPAVPLWPTAGVAVRAMLDSKNPAGAQSTGKLLLILID
jgi:hypothetical protein